MNIIVELWMRFSRFVSNGFRKFDALIGVEDGPPRSLVQDCIGRASQLLENLFHLVAVQVVVFAVRVKPVGLEQIDEYEGVEHVDRH